MKTLMRAISLSGLALFAAAATLGCAVEPGPSEKDQDTAESLESALTGSIRDLGEIPGTGEARTARYTASPRYSAYTFNANGGDEVEVTVTGAGREDAMAWVLDPRGRHLGFNDDATPKTLAARVTTKVPASLGTKAKLRVAFREYSLNRATFTVTVRVKPGMLACSTDSDCVKVSRGGCCTGWQSIAVNASRAQDYADANLCLPPYPQCAPPPRDADDGSAQVARCEAGTCALGAPRGCDYNGVLQAVGDSFPSSDGCNTCTCMASGGVACTKRACLPSCDPAKEPNRKYVGHSPEQCMLIRYACEPNTNGFSNACGCGCEQAANCPAFINCMPGPGVPSCAPERARCPYTPVAY